MQRDYPRERPWRGREDEVELWGREMDREDWIRGTYGPGGMPQGEFLDQPAYGRRWARRRWERRPERREAWPGRRDWPSDYAADWLGRGRRGEEAGEGRHWHGRTPARGYRRSDERIREDVYERLMEHPGLDTSDVEVSVASGEVTLDGSVDARAEKRLAEDLAEGVLGVTDVHNRLRVQQAGARASASVHVARPETEPTGGHA